MKQLSGQFLEVQPMLVQVPTKKKVLTKSAMNNPYFFLISNITNPFESYIYQRQIHQTKDYSTTAFILLMPFATASSLIILNLPISLVFET